jgi:hypothetical protein
MSSRDLGSRGKKMSGLKWRSSTALLAVLVLSVTGLGVGCGTGDEFGDSPDASAEVVGEQDSAPDGDPGATSTTSTTTAPASAGVESIDVGGVDLPRRVTYAGFEVTVDEAAAVADQREGPGVALTVTVRNLFSEIGTFAATNIGLVDGDGTRLQSIGFGDPKDPAAGYVETGPVEVTPNGKVQRTAFVPVEGALDLADSALSVAEPKMLPATVPLSGEVPESAFPLPVTVPTEPVVLHNIFDLTLTLKSAELTEEYGRKRAPEGTHLVVLQLRMAANGGHPYADGNTVRLVVDGTPLAAVVQDPPGAAGLVTGGADDLTFVYELPDDHQEVSMLGVSEGDIADHPFAITVPPLPGT